MNRYMHIGIFLETTKIGTLQRFAENRHRELPDDKPAISSPIPVDGITHGLLQQHAGHELARRFPTQSYFKKSGMTFKSSVTPSPSSMVTFSGTDVLNHLVYEALGHITAIVHYTNPASTSPLILLCIAKYGTTEQDPLTGISGLDAKFYSTEVDRHHLFFLDTITISHVVVSPWDARRQLAIKHEHMEL
jgi:hypothetical protein